MWKPVVVEPRSPKSTIKIRNPILLRREQLMSQSELPSYGAPPDPGYVSTEQVEESARLGPVQRFMGIIFSPGETFADINRKPTWLVPLIISIVVAGAFGFAFESIVKPDWNEIVRVQARKAAERFGGQAPSDSDLQAQVAITKTINKFAFIVGPIIGTFFVAGIFALGLMIMSAKTTFKKILSVISWSGAVTGVIWTVVVIASFMLRDEEGLREVNPSDPKSWSATNIGALLPADTSPAIKALAGSFDVITIWYLILLTMGFAAIAGAKKFTSGKTATLVFGLWAVWVLIAMGLGSMFG